MSWSSSSSELITKGASWVAKGVASLALFLVFGPHSSSSYFLILLSCICLEEWEVQGPDIRPSTLGLYFLVGLGDQLLFLFCPCLPVVLLRLIPFCVFCCANLLSLSLVTLLGVWYLFQGFLQVDEVQGSMVTAEWPLGVLTYTSESTMSWGIQTVMRTSPLLVLLQVADTSGPWMAGGVVRLLQFLYTFPWAMLQNTLYQYYLTFWPYKSGFVLFRPLLESGALCFSFQF